MGHLIRNCPNKNIEGEEGNKNGIVKQGSEGNDGKEYEVEVQEVVSAVIKNVVDRSVEVEAESASSRTEQVESNSNVYLQLLI